MSDLWRVLGALAVVVVPLALAGWLLSREDDTGSRRRCRKTPRAKMPR